MNTTRLANGTVHDVPADLQKTLVGNDALTQTWNSLTPLARNEWICWVITNKKPETRENHIQRLKVELTKGKRRPCCWAGCPHRPDRVVKIYTKGYRAASNG